MDGGKKTFYRYLRARFPYGDYENYYSSDESTEDDGEDYTDGMNHYYENNRDAFDEADSYSENSSFEEGGVISHDSNSYPYMNSSYAETYFEEYSDATENSDSYYEDDGSVNDGDSYSEENRDTDEYSDSNCDNSANYFSPYYEKKHGPGEGSEIVYRSNEGLDDIITKSESSVLLLFYGRLLEDLMQNFFVSSSDVRGSIQLLICSYKLVNRGQLPLEIDFNCIQYCLGYMHRYGASHMALVFEAVSTILKKSIVFLSMMSKEKLNVVFLGGGPCNDLLGFLAALHGRHNLLSLNVSVVDKMPGWKNIFMGTVDRLRRGDFGEAGRVFRDLNVTSSFISADLTEFFWLE
ncbi:unnamed protein product [Larinioides sclopetarius]|uniref:Uncharacterized protein n=1 Tax=Larinioides sclopetarius TaxID=280406 RepID=A0AAV1ZNN6_9ARAC